MGARKEWEKQWAAENDTTQKLTRHRCRSAIIHKSNPDPAARHSKTLNWRLRVQNLKRTSVTVCIYITEIVGWARVPKPVFFHN